ncbi:hypothetical protein [Marinobacter sp.]|uniref:hypothetical protein n=1 Tax=Marinobacter sp. TaxID=50741 RepID=UPI001A0331B6|nr:hypothetical protein [Marinobacter sp.]MBE0485612.1 hypothetical protein [Marinobacter sp.]
MREQAWSSASGLANARRVRFLVALVVLFTLWWVLTGKLASELERAEQQSVNMVLSQLRSALVIKGAEAMLSREQSLERLVGENPFEWLDHQWPMYQGQCSEGAPKHRHWCFAPRRQKETGETGKGWLIYNPRQPITIDGKVAEPDQPLAWTVTTEFANRNGKSLREQDGRPTGLKLAPLPFAETTVNRQDAQR